MVLLVGTHITRKSPCHIMTMAMGWTEYVLKRRRGPTQRRKRYRKDRRE